jgi:hypothetical protein
MKNYKILKNFLSDKECNSLNKWILKNKKEPFFKDADMGGKRLSTRFSHLVPFPKIAFSIKNRLIKKLNILKVEHPPFCHGMVASLAFVEDTLYMHKDPIWKEGLKTLHCNVILSDSLGGSPIIENEKLNLKKGDMWCYLVSDVEHGADKVLGDIPRTMWVFGFLINQEVYDRLQ